MQKSRVIAVLLLTCFFATLSGSAHAWENPAFTVATFGSSTNEVPNAVATDSLGNIFVAGYFAGTTDFDPSSAVDSATSNGLGDAFIAKYSPTGSLIWSQEFGGSEDDQIIAMAIDTSNNIYVTGTFKTTVDFDYTAGSESVTANGSGTDIFVSKITSNGARLWTKTFGGNNANDTAYAISVDASGNVISTGVFQGTVDFDPGAGTSSVASSGSFNDIYVQKLNTNGEFIWVKTLANSQSNDEARGIATFSNGDVAIVGGFGANTIATDFDPGSGVFGLLAGSVNHNIFIWKLNSDGTFGWAKSVGNAATADRAYAVTIDSNSNVYTTGAFQSSAAFSPAGETLTAQAGYDAFVTKHNSSGEFQWVKHFAGSGNEYGRSLATDSASNVYVTGAFSASLDLNPNAGSNLVNTVGATDLFISKMNSSGDYLWAKNLGSTSTDTFITSAIDINQNYFTTGYVSGSVAITSNSSTLNTPFTGAVDGLFLCLTSAGDFSCGSSTASSSISSDEQQRISREERERAVQKARNEVSSMLISGLPLTRESLAAADFSGVTDRNIALINADIDSISKREAIDLTTISKIVKKYELLGRVESKGIFYFAELLQSGLVSNLSPHRTMILIQLRNLPRESVDTEEELKAAIVAIEKVYLDRNLRFQEVMARIKSR
jgi:hypothetical protein